MPQTRFLVPVLLLTLVLLPGLGAIFAGRVAAAMQPSDAAATARTNRQWLAGTLDLPGPRGAIPVGLVLCLAPTGEDSADTAWVGSFDLVPGAGTLGVSAIECERVRLTATELEFVVAPPVSATFRLARAAGDAPEYTGSVTIEGLPELRASLRPVSEAEAKSRMIPRPQTPRPPFPYTREDVAIDASADSVTLAGTLTLPDAASHPGKRPAVILVSDSGAQDRDHADGHHRPFFVIADHLTRRGFAVLRLDDRGAGRTPGAPPETTVDIVASDVRSAAAKLATRDDIDAERIGAIGLGEGALIASLAAAEDPTLAYLVLLAPPGLPGKEVALLREVRRMEAEGEDPEFIESQIARSRRVLDLVTEGADQETIAEAVREVALGAARALRGDGVLPDDEQLGQMAAQQAFFYTAPAMKRWLVLDPTEPLGRLRVPVLALAGDMDLIVTTGDNFPKVEAALEGSDAEVTTKRFPSLNHMFQPATTGFADESPSIQTTIHPEVLGTITQWLTSVTTER